MRPVRVVVALVCLAGVLSACGARGDKHDVVAYFEDAGDLVRGGRVQVNDVEVGSVEDIDLVLQEGRMLARVGLSIDDGVSFPAANLGAVVRQTSLLGEQFVQLVVDQAASGASIGEEPVVIPVERTARRVDVETFLSDLSGFIGRGGLEDLNKFTTAQALILEDRGQRFGQVIDELSRFTEVLAGRRLDVGAAIDHLAAASGTVADNRATLDSFLDSLDEANVLLADQGDRLGALFRGLGRFGSVNARFLADHEEAINRQIRALRPIFRGVAGAQAELRSDLEQLNTFFRLFPKSLGGGPGGRGFGDYVQADAILCEKLSDCHTRGEKGDVPGQGSR